ncbi:hypothetical protein AC249_AIPGENE5078 [Exaiptasia diaphana]|nr:hypothetical protein AC249_AIPGENE5078 [Exaiptasia diaphana]
MISKPKDKLEDGNKTAVIYVIPFGETKKTLEARLSEHERNVCIRKTLNDNQPRTPLKIFKAAPNFELAAPFIQYKGIIT